MPVRTRKLLGTFVLIIWMTAYTFGCMLIGVHLLPDNYWVRLVFYPLAGILWVFPARPLFIWMRGG